MLCIYHRAAQKEIQPNISLGQKAHALKFPSFTHTPQMSTGRINTAVRSDIVELTGIPGVKGYRARVLYKAG